MYGNSSITITSLSSVAFDVTYFNAVSQSENSPKKSLSKYVCTVFEKSRRFNESFFSCAEKNNGFLFLVNSLRSSVFPTRLRP